MENDQQQAQPQQHTKIPDTNTVNIKEFIGKCMRRWYWFVITIVLCLSVAYLYLLRTPSVYTRSAEVMIKSDSKGKSTGDISNEFSNLGLFTTNAKVNNELKAFQSTDLMAQVVDRLCLDINYYEKGKWHDNILYGSDNPIKAEFIDLPDNEGLSFKVSKDENGKLTLSDFKGRKEDDLENETAEGMLGDTINTAKGGIVISKSPFYDDDWTTIDVRKAPRHNTINAYSKGMNVTLADKQADVIALSTDDISPQRAEDVLNMLILVYNESWVKDKNQVTTSTSSFINERLEVIEKELASVDSDISSYKSTNLVPDVTAAANMYMQQNSQLDIQMRELSNELYMTKYIRTSLQNEDGWQLIPSASGTGSDNLETQIGDYNNKVLQRNNLVANSSEKNSLVQDLNRELQTMKIAILTSVDNQILSLQTRIDNLQNTERKTTAKIAANPEQAQQLLSVERQQQVKQSLYLFLLQKREENELSQAFTAYNTRVLQLPGGSILPTSPNKRNIMIIAFLLGLLIPAGIIYLRQMMDTKIRSKKDIENITIPYIGEIPLVRKMQKFLIFFKKFKPMESQKVVKPGKRDAANEAFRVLRTNLEFMVTDKESNVILTTSFNPGSGKSYLTLNIALSLAIKNKKVLLIDADLRKGTTSAVYGSPQIGMSNYLTGKLADWHEALVTDPDYSGLNVLPVGVLPPNPAELVGSKKFEQLISEVKTEFDYVLLDCAPINVVADTQIMERCADRTIFVVRAGLFDKQMLQDLQELYDEKKFKNMSMILNGVDYTSGHYGHYGQYGYGRYGYGKYGYGYGGYGYGSYGATDDKED